MKNYLAFSIVLILCLTTHPLVAGDTQYRILCITGDVQTQQSGSRSWKSARTNQMLSTDVTVRIGNKGGYCCLLSGSGSPVELREPGTTALASLAPAKTTSTMSEISSFLEKSLNAPKQKQRYVGSVYRSGDSKQSSIVFPYDTRLLDSTVRLVWKNDPSAQSYTLTIRDAGKQDVLQLQLGDTSYTINLGSLKNIRRGDCIYWNAHKSSSGRVDEKPYALCWVSKQEADSIRQENMKFRQQERGELNPAVSPIAAMLNGAWFEKLGYFAEALRYYEMAEKMVPDVKEFRSAKSTLLARLGM